MNVNLGYYPCVHEEPNGGEMKRFAQVVVLVAALLAGCGEDPRTGEPGMAEWQREAFERFDAATDSLIRGKGLGALLEQRAADRIWTTDEFEDYETEVVRLLAAAGVPDPAGYIEHRACTVLSVRRADDAWNAMVEREWPISVRASVYVHIGERVWRGLTMRERQDLAKIAGAYQNCIESMRLGLQRDTWEVSLYSMEAWDRCDERYELARLRLRDGEWILEYPEDPPPELREMVQPKLEVGCRG